MKSKYTTYPWNLQKRVWGCLSPRVCWGQTLELKDLRVTNFTHLNPSISSTPHGCFFQVRIGSFGGNVVSTSSAFAGISAHLGHVATLVMLIGCEWMYGILNGCGAGSYRLVFF